MFRPEIIGACIARLISAIHTQFKRVAVGYTTSRGVPPTKRRFAKSKIEETTEHKFPLRCWFTVAATLLGPNTVIKTVSTVFSNSAFSTTIRVQSNHLPPVSPSSKIFMLALKPPIRWWACKQSHARFEILVGQLDHFLRPPPDFLWSAHRSEAGFQILFSPSALLSVQFRQRDWTTSEPKCSSIFLERCVWRRGV